MSYLTDSVHEIESNDSASFYHVQETDVVELNNLLDAHELAERMYGRSYKYSGAFHTVAQETEDGYYVMVMEENL